MKKGKITMIITIGLMFFILTMVISIQFRTITSTDIVALENMREEELKKELTTLKAKHEATYKKLSDTLTKISEYEKTRNTENETLSILNEEVEETRDLLGKTDVIGTGVVITITDTMKGKVSSEDLLTLINLLKSAGAEAISINDQRIVYDSYIVNPNPELIRLNARVITSPYIVKAIGNTAYLESSISQKDVGYVDTEMLEGKNIEVEKKEKISILKYTGDLNFENIREEEEK